MQGFKFPGAGGAEKLPAPDKSGGFAERAIATALKAFGLDGGEMMKFGNQILGELRTLNERLAAIEAQQAELMKRSDSAHEGAAQDVALIDAILRSTSPEYHIARLELADVETAIANGELSAAQPRPAQ